MESRPLDRRHFAKHFAAGAGALAAGLGGGVAHAQEKVNPENRPKPLRRPTGLEGEQVFGTNERMHRRTSGTLKGDWFVEDAREIPVVADYDVIVCGGGPAGFAAALAAARSGAKTALIEVDRGHALVDPRRI